MKALNIVTLLLIIVGGVNRLFVGNADFDLVAALFGADSAITNLVYVLVGLSALWQIFPFVKALSVGEVRSEAHISR